MKCYLVESESIPKSRQAVYLSRFSALRFIIQRKRKLMQGGHNPEVEGTIADDGYVVLYGRGSYEYYIDASITELELL